MNSRRITKQDEHRKTMRAGVVQHAPRRMRPLRRENRWLEQHLARAIVPRYLLLPCRPRYKGPLRISESCSSLPRRRGCVTVAWAVRELAAVIRVDRLSLLRYRLVKMKPRTHLLCRRVAAIASGCTELTFARKDNGRP